MKYSPIKMSFGIGENSTLVHISEVEKCGKRNYKCLSCGTNLIPVKGNKRQNHFRHYVVSACDGESVIHKAAKQIVLERMQITLPNKDSVCFESACEEVPLQGIIADILAVTEGVELVIEIYYRHKVDDNKIEKIKNANISAIEIDLSNLNVEHLENMDSFWSCINNPNRVTWIHQATSQQKNSGLLNLTAEEIEQLKRAYELMQEAKRNQVGQIEQPLPRPPTARRRQDYFTTNMSTRVLNRRSGRF